MNSKQKVIDKLKARIREIDELITDVSRPDWSDLVQERNSLSVNLKGMKKEGSKYQRKKPYINTISLKQWGI